MKNFFIIFALTLFAIMGNANTPPRGEMDNDGIESVSEVMEFVGIIQKEDAKQSSLTCPDGNHPHLIDLGLPSGTKWSCCNVGSDKPEAYGGYYAWGQVEEKGYYASWNSSIRIESSHAVNHIPGSDIAGTKKDVAHVKWGDCWVMPSLDQIEELVCNCNYSWCSKDGVIGAKFTGPSGGTIFLPAAGYRMESDLYDATSFGYYWSSSSPSETHMDNNSLYFDSGGASYYGSFYNSRYYDGYTVRPVSKK